MASVRKASAFDTATLERLAAEYQSQHLDERLFSHDRTPVVLSTSSWLLQDKFISLWINPLNTSWSLPRRETTTKTAAGVIRNTWRNRYRNTYYDEFTINFTFQTGNILPSVTVTDRILADSSLAYGAAKNPKPPPGLVDFYRFLSMVDQPMLTSKSENRHIVFYRSRVFPRLRLEGYFVGETPITFTESAEGNANMLQWTATFQVYDSTPKIWQAARLISDWSNWAYKNAMSEILPDTYPMWAIEDKIAAEQAAEAKSNTKPKPTKGSNTAPKSSKEISTSKTQKKTIGLVTGAQRGKGKTAVTSPRDPNIQPGTKIVNGKLVPS